MKSEYIQNCRNPSGAVSNPVHERVLGRDGWAAEFEKSCHAPPPLMYREHWPPGEQTSGEGAPVSNTSAVPL